MNVAKPIPVIAEVMLASALHPDGTPSTLSRAEARIAQLATLKPLDYELAREGEAKTLGIRVSVLDAAVNVLRPQAPEGDSLGPFAALKPWGEAVDGAALLAEMQATILRFCVLPDHSAPLIAAWVLHAWVHDAAVISPVLTFVSPEKRCGKTTALSVIGVLVPKAKPCSGCIKTIWFYPTTATSYRTMC